MYRLKFSGVFLCCILVACWAAVAAADVKLPAILSDNMVLQRGRAVPIWGWADNGEEIHVAVAGQTLSTKADEEGRWKVALGALEAGGPLEMTVRGSSGETVTVKNILVGEVWICSGQSNMGWTVGQSQNAEQEIAAANFPDIRLFPVGLKKSPDVERDCTGRWFDCRPDTVRDFSAVAYFFGRRLHQDLNVPVGLIRTAWGGTAAELWTSRKALEADPALNPLAGQGESSVLYNAMIAPLVPYAIQGAIWYQGESNVPRAHQYRTLFPAMIADWRFAWGQGDFPFGFVQIAPYRYKGQDPANGAELREAQLMTLQSTPNTGMAVILDVGDANNVHPTNKQEVSRRLALWALSEVYGRELVYSGPVYRSMSVEGNKIRLAFDHVAGALIASDGKPLRDFTIAGSDQVFLPAKAEIDGDSIVVQSDQVAQPVAVRYAWRDDATPNLANQEGLPASSFRTDAWKGATEP